MRLLITGASGFIGKNFLLNSRDYEIIALYNKSRDFLEFLDKNELHNVTAVRCDLRQGDDVKRMFDSMGSIDTCLYMAANSDPGYSFHKPLEDLNSNLFALINFLEHFQGERVIFMSSGAVYDGLKGMVSPESKLEPRLPYAISKLASEYYIKFYSEKRKSFSTYTILRFFGAYGPHEPERKIYSKLVKTFSIEGENSFEIYGDGENYIDAMYVDDTITALLKVVEKDSGSAVLDFCASDPIRIKDLILRAGRTFGKEDARVIKRGVSHEHIEFFVSLEGFNRIYKFTPEISLEAGLRKLDRFLRRDG